ncbi:MAG: hypothetical protein M0R20_04645 [Candidatus Omnitrophica bacterium]|jgi:hypothetical protein|nr:hypothetical protein [Candidatus Omnitrophota bacterium]
MSNISLIENKGNVTGNKATFSWKDIPSMQRLLDVISSILAEEYIIIAKQSPDIFLKHKDVK